MSDSPTLELIDHRRDPAAWATALGVSRDAVDLYLDSEVVDLHIDLYVPARLYGYDVHRRHRPRFLGWRFTGQTDLPRIREARLAAAILDVATNPARRGARRGPVTARNVARVAADLARHPGDFRLVTNHTEYLAARAEGLTACYVAIQGGQAFQDSPEAIAAIPAEVHRITLVHLTNSQVGCTSSPLGVDNGGLTPRGLELVAAMNARRILVDLAHINRQGFFDAANAHDKSQPLICTHTGVSGVFPHWRNLDDEQVRTIADTGGVVGIMFHGMFLDGSKWRYVEPELVVRHMEHVIKVAGEDAVAIGTDYDGMVIPPAGLGEVTRLPVLVQCMLTAGWSERRIRGALGANALKTFAAIRP